LLRLLYLNFMLCCFLYSELFIVLVICLSYQYLPYTLVLQLTVHVFYICVLTTYIVGWTICFTTAGFLCLKLGRVCHCRHRVYLVWLGVW